jgi:hypothetical protein
MSVGLVKLKFDWIERLETEASRKTDSIAYILVNAHIATRGSRGWPRSGFSGFGILILASCDPRSQIPRAGPGAPNPIWMVRREPRANTTSHSAFDSHHSPSAHLHHALDSDCAAREHWASDGVPSAKGDKHLQADLQG